MTTNPPSEDLSGIDYGALGLAVREAILQHFRVYSCINAVAAIVDAAAALGGKALPLSVGAFIFSPRITEAIGDPSSPDAPQRLQAAVQSGGRESVALGVRTVAQPLRGSWGGHLVAVVDHFKPNRSLVIDATLEQANQPAVGIVLRPAFLVVTPQDLKRAFRQRINGCEVQYKAFPNDTSFCDTGAWSNQDQRGVVRNSVLSLLDSGRS